MKPLDRWTACRQEDVDILRRCKSAVTATVGDAEVILYGSRARGDAHEDSDYDIVVVVNGPVDMALEDRIRAKVYPLELETGALITLIVYSRDEWQSALHQATPFHKAVQQEGVRL